MFDNFNFDRRKIVVLSLVFLLISISYINYMINKNSILQSSSELEEFEESQMEILENNEEDNIVIHQNTDENNATSSIDLVEDETQIVDSQKNEADNIIAVSNDNIEETLLNDENNVSKYFLQAKIDIEIEREQTIERFDEIINNNLVDEESRKNAVNRKLNLIDNMNKEKIIESLIKGKGFEDVIVFITDKSVYVTVKSDDIANTDIAKILDIVNRETEVLIDNIKIQNK